MTYKENRRWSDQYLPAIVQIIAPHLIQPAMFEYDVKQATDLMVLTGRDMRIAARVRRSSYAARYPYDFTIRSKHDNGAKTELAKMLEGWGDWMFYGHADQTEKGKLNRWMLIDLHKWRKKLLGEGYRGGWEHLAQSQSNGDGTHFMAFDVRKMPEVLIASSGGGMFSDL